jgi:hypothetical protein
MPQAATTGTKHLFKRWRQGDAAAGNAMAQRFTDWYYAIAVCRLGEPQAGEPFRTACSQFSKGVAKVAEARTLHGWAHQIAKTQIRGHLDSGWLHDGDLPNAFSRLASPKQLLMQARTELTAEMRVLESAYTGAGQLNDPITVLRARYALKRWLRQHASAPFKIIPVEPDLDLTPLPFYESAKMTSAREEASFELFMLEEQTICQDIAEFAHFALALRGGLPQSHPKRRVTTAAETAPVPVRTTFPKGLRDALPQRTPQHNTPLVIAFALGLFFLLGVLWILANSNVS